MIRDFFLAGVVGAVCALIADALLRHFGVQDVDGFPIIVGTVVFFVVLMGLAWDYGNNRFWGG